MLLKTEERQPDIPQAEVDPESDAEPEEEENWFVCRNCRQKLTRPSERTSVNGSHTHTFANPSGIVFEIACFNFARGYSFMGPPSAEFVWFAGYTWRIITCSSCLTHLGWYFSSVSTGGFFALIVDRISLHSSRD